MASTLRLIISLCLYILSIHLKHVIGKPSRLTLSCIEEALIDNDASRCYYPEITASQTIRELRDKWIVFMGESTLRQMFLQFLGIIKSESYDRIPDQKGNRIIEERLAGSRFTFYYLEYYDNLTSSLSDGPPVLYDGRKPDLLILNDGLHDLLYDYSNIDKSWKKLSNVLTTKYAEYNIPIMWIPSPQIHDEYLTKHRKEAAQFNNDTIYKQLVIKQKELFQKKLSKSSFPAYYYNIFGNISYSKWNFDGIHSMERARIEAVGLVRTFYYLDQDVNAWNTDKLTPGQIMTFLCYSIIFIIVILGQTAKYLFYGKPPQKVIVLESISSTEETNTLLSTTTPNEEISHRVKPSRPDLDTTAAAKDNGNGSDENVLSLPVFFQDTFIESLINCYISNNKYFIASFEFGICLVLLYLFDGPEHFFVSPSLKHYNRDFFIFLHLIFLLISYLTFKQNESRDADKILSRLQTEEWKGIMQIIFVMYHYYDADEVYNIIRVFIGAYVWMTGFGNTVFFLQKQVFNVTRLFGMLFRLNWLVFWVCLILNESLMLYYICPLHTFFFLMCYVLWGIAYKYNEKKYVIELKLILCGLFLFILYDVLSINVFYIFWSPFSFLLSFHGTLYEWHFRTNLDHYATWMGMVFAVYYDSIYKFLTVNLKNSFYSKILIAIICVILLILWFNFVYLHDKYTYNEYHPYTESIPIFTYIILRNLYDPLRKYYSSFLAWMGQITLETYIFQYHLYMINDAKSILTIFDQSSNQYPLCNFVIVSIIYLFISRRAFNATNILRNFFYPVSKSKPVENIKVIKQTAIYASVLLVFYIISYLIVILINQ